jgi:hypothetical protein
MPVIVATQPDDHPFIHVVLRLALNDRIVDLARLNHQEVSRFQVVALVPDRIAYIAIEEEIKLVVVVDVGQNLFVTEVKVVVDFQFRCRHAAVLGEENIGRKLSDSGHICNIHQLRGFHWAIHLLHIRTAAKVYDLCGNPPAACGFQYN